MQLEEIENLEHVGITKGILKEGKRGVDYLIPLLKRFLDFFKVPWQDECCGTIGEAGMPVGYRENTLQYYNTFIKDYVIIPINTGADPIEFRVSGSSYIITGQNTKTVTTFIGKNLEFVRNNQIQSTLTDEPSYYTWNKNTGELFIFPNPVAGEILKIKNG